MPTITRIAAEDMNAERRTEYIERLFAVLLNVAGTHAWLQRLLVELRVLQSRVSDAREVSLAEIIQGADGRDEMASAITLSLLMPLTNLVAIESLNPQHRIAALITLIEELAQQVSKRQSIIQDVLDAARTGEHDSSRVVRARLEDVRAAYEESTANKSRGLPFVQYRTDKRGTQSYYGAMFAVNFFRAAFAQELPFPDSFAAALARMEQWQATTWRIKTDGPENTWLLAEEDWALGPASQLRHDLAEVWGMMICIHRSIPIPPYRGPSDGMKKTYRSCGFSDSVRQDEIRTILASWDVPIWLPDGYDAAVTKE